MRNKTIVFQNQVVVCVFPTERSELAQAAADLNLNDSYPVIVLIGGGIEDQHLDVTRRAIKTLARIAEDMKALIICGGTDMGVMAEIGHVRSENQYKFPLVGIAPEDLVTWPDGPHGTKFLLWGKKRWSLEPHYSHFILVPGGKFGDESPWIVSAATLLSNGHKSVTILINGGDVSRRDVDLSVLSGRPVIALSRTGRLADEFSRQPGRNKLISVVPANSEPRIIEAVRTALSVQERSAPAEVFKERMYPTVV